MHPLTERIFFTRKVVIAKDLMGNPIEAEGLFFNWFGRNLVWVVLSVWSAAMLLATWCK
jgi:hypothetical protein